MLSLIQVLVLSFVMLFSTTIDDLVVLFTMCFHIVNADEPDEIKHTNLRYTYIGYLLGFSFVIACSLIGLLINHFAKIDERYVALLGFFPILLGSYNLYHICKEKCKSEETTRLTEASTIDGNIAYVTSYESMDNKSHGNFNNNCIIRVDSNTKRMGSIDLERGSFTSSDGDLTVEEDEEMNYFAKKILFVFESLGMNKVIAKAFCLTFSVGSDNIIIYISFFLQISYSDIAIAIAIFLSISVIYGYLAIKLAKRFEETLKKYSDYLEPVAALAIIGIGAYIVSESIIFNN